MTARCPTCGQSVPEGPAIGSKVRVVRRGSTYAGQVGKVAEVDRERGGALFWVTFDDGAAKAFYAEELEVVS